MRFGSGPVGPADAATWERPDVWEGGKLGDAVPQQYLVSAGTLPAENHGG